MNVKYRIYSFIFITKCKNSTRIYQATIYSSSLEVSTLSTQDRMRIPHDITTQYKEAKQAWTTT